MLVKFISAESSITQRANVSDDDQPGQTDSLTPHPPHIHKNTLAFFPLQAQTVNVPFVTLNKIINKMLNSD